MTLFSVCRCQGHGTPLSTIHTHVTINSSGFLLFSLPSSASRNPLSTPPTHTHVTISSDGFVLLSADFWVTHLTHTHTDVTINSNGFCFSCCLSLGHGAGVVSTPRKSVSDGQILCLWTNVLGLYLPNQLRPTRINQTCHSRL